MEPAKPSIQALEALLVSMLEAATAEATAQNPGAKPEGQYWQVLKKAFVAAQLGAYPTETEAETDGDAAAAARRLEHAMAARIWLAHLVEMPTGAWRLPGRVQLHSICVLLEAQIGRGQQREQGVDADLTRILSKHGNISYEEDGISSLLSLFEGSVARRKLNCIDIVFLAHALYQWMGYTVYCIGDDAHAWLQDRAPPLDHDAAVVARQILQATRFYDVMDTKSWHDYDYWVQHAGHTYDGRHGIVMGSASMNFYFMYRAAVMRATDSTLPDRASRYKFMRIYADAVGEFISGVAASQRRVPAVDMADIQSRLGAGMQSTLMYDLLHHTRLDTPLAPHIKFLPESWMKRIIQLHQAGNMARVGPTSLLPARILLDDLDNVGATFVDDLAMLAVWHEQRGGYNGFVKLTNMLEFVGEVHTFRANAMIYAIANAHVDDPEALADAAMAALRVFARAIVSYTRMNPEAIEALGRLGQFLDGLVLAAGFRGYARYDAYTQAIGNVVKQTIADHYDMEETGTLKTPGATPPGVTDGAIQWPSMVETAADEDSVAKRARYKDLYVV